MYTQAEKSFVYSAQVKSVHQKQKLQKCGIAIRTFASALKKEKLRESEVMSGEKMSEMRTENECGEVAVVLSASR